MHAAKRRLAVVVVATAIVAAPARRAHAADAWLNLGASEVRTLPGGEHYGVYAYVAVTFPFDVHAQELYLIPGFGFELTPEHERGGLVGYLTLERVLSARVAGDLILTLVHDQHRLDWDDAVFSLGVGLGVSVTVGKLVLSPSCSVYRTIGSPDWSVAPVLNVAFEL